MTSSAFRDHPFFGFVDWVLRGVGQVVFQNNPLSGALIVFALFFNSWIYGTICLFGVIVSTVMAILLKAERGLIKDGLFGFNGALVALALVAFTSENFRTGAVPSAHLLVYIAFAAALTAILFSSFSAVLATYKVAPLTMPFVLTGWLFLFAVLKFSAIDAGPLVKPISPDQYPAVASYDLPTWYMGIGNAIGQIFSGQLYIRLHHPRRHRASFAHQRSHGVPGSFAGGHGGGNIRWPRRRDPGRAVRI